MNNNSSSDLYVSRNPSVFVSTSTSASSAKLTLAAASPYPLVGDISSVYIIPHNSHRIIALAGMFGNYGMSGSVEFKINKIYFGNDVNNLIKFNIDDGLEKLSSVVVF